MELTRSVTRRTSTKSRPTPGVSPWRERWCRVCGYGIVVAGRLPACPTCRSYDWADDFRRIDTDSLL